MQQHQILQCTGLGLILPALLLVAGCQNTPDTMPQSLQPTPLTAEAAEAGSSGQTLFENNCATCHGQFGENNPGGSGDINFTSKAWQKTHTDAYIRTTVKDGKSFMPAFETTFTAAELNTLVKYIRILPKQAE